ncbi:ATP-binding cassette sub-family B member 10, mitochondrial [Folsomia candida]|uniref:ATP-binding cassette sub-family B member 10, mitochondrial n=1 Tax=Folsomia candida TaxID=158441 RepID=A0A226EPX0_FOLCA|nr:ATP-binding cassette sub-family B member 10, mitochondrial [Folsomia candida]OXA59539.1 ATP-binding cassette sub-family B member 10, mitochondrial [Folsomia candida]
MWMSNLSWTRWTGYPIRIGQQYRRLALVLTKPLSGGPPGRATWTLKAFLNGKHGVPVHRRNVADAKFHGGLNNTGGGYVLTQFIVGKRKLFTSALKLVESNNNITISASKNLVKKTVPKKEFGRLLSLAKSEKWTLTGAITLLLVSSVVTMSIPFCLGKVIDIIYTGDNPETTKDNLKKVSLALLGVFLIGGLCNFGRTYLMQLSGQRITNKMRTNVFSSILKQDIAFFDKNKTGELINRLSADTSLVSQSVTMNISDGLRSTFMITAGVGMMIYVSPKLAIVGLSIVPPVAGMAIMYGRYVRNITKKVQDSLATATQVAEERISNIRTVRAFSQEGLENRIYENRITELMQLAYKEALAKGIFFGMTGLSGNFIILSVLYYGGAMVSDHTITVGALSAFLLYAAYTGVALGGLSSFYSEMMKGLGASTRLWELIDRQPSIPLSGGIVMKELEGNIKFTNVSFAYQTRADAPIFSNVNLSIPAGSILAIVGASGSGKSTLGSLLLRYYDPTSGVISIDGTNISDLDPHFLRQQIGTVSQEPILFSCSIRDNILYGAMHPEEVSEERIHEVAQEANALDFILKFPQKFDTVVGERGIMLSGGQRQRIAIARALIKNPRILLFDEATSALDASSEHLVQEALERVAKNRTVISIAHRLSTIRNADNIAVLSEGKFVEVGAYEDLMTIENGMFRKLVERQTIQQ